MVQTIDACYKSILILLEEEVNRDSFISHLEGFIVVSIWIVHVVASLLKVVRRLRQ